jgi:prophage regulatory protein
MTFERQQLLTAADVLAATGYKSRTTLYRRMKAADSDFPKPVSLGFGKIRWRAGEIEDWIKNLPQQSY